MTKEESIKELISIPGVGKSLSANLYCLGIKKVTYLQNKKSEVLYSKLNRIKGVINYRCVLYVFRCAVYYANTPEKEIDPELLKWWNWKDVK